MIGSRPQLRRCSPLALAALLAASSTVAYAKDDNQPQVPTCDK